MKLALCLDFQLKIIDSLQEYIKAWYPILRKVYLWGCASYIFSPYNHVLLNGDNITGATVANAFVANGKWGRNGIKETAQMAKRIPSTFHNTIE